MYLHCCLYGVLYDMFDVTLYTWREASAQRGAAIGAIPTGSESGLNVAVSRSDQKMGRAGDPGSAHACDMLCSRVLYCTSTLYTTVLIDHLLDFSMPPRQFMSQNSRLSRREGTESLIQVFGGRN